MRASRCAWRTCPRTGAPLGSRALSADALAARMPFASGGRASGQSVRDRKLDDLRFSAADEHALARFATLAIENERVRRRVRDLAITEKRERIACEMHDRLTQSVQEQLKTGHPSARRHRWPSSATASGACALARPQRNLLEASRVPGKLAGAERGWRPTILEPADAQLIRLAPPAELQLLRIVQEARANLRKHAAASCVRVRVTETAAARRDDLRGRRAGISGAEGTRAAERRSWTAVRTGNDAGTGRAEPVGGQLEIQSARRGDTGPGPHPRTGITARLGSWRGGVLRRVVA
jgi:hypothetical protein